MAGPAARAHAEAERALLRAADPVEAALAVGHHGAAALVEQPVHARRVGALLREPLGAEPAAGLLVDDGDDLQLSARGPPALAREVRRGHRLGRGLGLHVDRAAAPQRAVVDLAGPRVVAPVGRIGEHRVDVREVAEHRALRLAPQSRDEVRALGILGAEQLALEPGVLEIALQPLLARALVAGRIDGVEADQPREDVSRLFLQVHAKKVAPDGIRPSDLTASDGIRLSVTASL